MKGSTNEAGTGGEGMSRAAKKRAKKKQKQITPGQGQRLALSTSTVTSLKEDSRKGEEKEQLATATKISAVGTDNDQKTTTKKRKNNSNEQEQEQEQEQENETRREKKEKKEKMEKKKKKNKKSVETEHVNAQDTENGHVDNNAIDIDEAVETMVSMLTPAQILLLDTIDENHAVAKIAAEEMSMDLTELLSEIPAKVRARCLMNSLLQPANLTTTQFHDQYREKQPLLVQSTNNSEEHRKRLDGFLSLQAIKTLMDKEPMCYGRDINVTRYEDTTGDGTKRRVTLDLLQPSITNDPSAAFVLADPKDVWSNYADSASTIRLLCPHKHIDAIHSMLSTLELELGCMVGANAYLTPPSSSQGFAPHYDDIDAFVLQLEGSKHWKVYPPMNRAETLPRQSSSDYTEEDLKGIDPIIDVVLQRGDMLYLPRGWIHQACTLPLSSSEHSVHLTMSAMQNWAWADFLELVMPEALEAASQSETSTSLREGLPRNFLDYMGAIHDASEELPEGIKQAMESQQKREEKENKESDNHTDDADTENVKMTKLKKKQDLFRQEAKKRIMRVCKEAMRMVDAGCDQIGKRFLSDRLPPALTQNELSFTSDSRKENGGKIWPNTLCRLARQGMARLVLEDGKAVMYHCGDNSRVYRGNPLSPMEFELDDAPALEMLLTTVEPHWICVQDLIHDDIEEKMDIAQTLYDEGILAILQTEKPDKSVQTG